MRNAIVRFLLYLLVLGSARAYAAPLPSTQFLVPVLPQLPDGSFSGRIEFWSNGVLLYSETGDFLSLGGVVDVLLTGGGDPIVFDSVFVNPATSILSGALPSVKLYALPGGGLPELLVADLPYSPVGSALWAVHSQDTALLQLNINQQVADELLARRAADAQLLQAALAYTDLQLGLEATARLAGDSNTLLAANLYTDTAVLTVDLQLALEISARLAGDSNTLLAANLYTDLQVTALQAEIDGTVRGYEKVTATSSCTRTSSS